MNLKNSHFIKVDGGRLYTLKENAVLVYCREQDGEVFSNGYITFSRNKKIEKAFHDCICFVAEDSDLIVFGKEKKIDEMDIRESIPKITEFPGDLHEIGFILYISKENKNKHQKAVIAIHEVTSKFMDIIYPIQK